MIYVFEPNSTVYEKLVHNLEKEKKEMKSYNLGIDSNSGKLEFLNNQIIDAISIFKTRY